MKVLEGLGMIYLLTPSLILFIQNGKQELEV